MKRVLSRSVHVESAHYPEGTPLEDVPADHDSLIFTGWTRIVEPARETLTESLAAEAEPEPESEPESVAEVAAVVSEPKPPKADADLRSITELDIEAGLIEMLVDAGIETIQDAIDYRTQNNGFRTIKGIGKQTDQLIVNAIEST